MPDFETHSEFERDVRFSFGRQKLMKLYGATPVRVEPGTVEFQTASSGFDDDVCRFLRPCLSRCFAYFDRPLAWPTPSVPNPSFICEHPLVFQIAR